MDSSVVVKYLSGTLAKHAVAFITKVIDEVPRISVITEIEILSWSNIEFEATVKGFVGDATILSLTPDIVTQCIRVKRSRRIKTPDAIIAATAITHSLTLLTTDNDFHGIDGLTVINPLKM
jgi:predicted nucleic acid-binding protein